MLGFNRTRTVDVAVAVYFADPTLGFLLEYNPKWRGYSFPSQKIRNTDALSYSAAHEAFRAATGLALRHIRSEPLFYSEVVRESQRTGQPTKYRYHGYEINPNADLAEGAPVGPGCRLVYLPIDRFPAADMLTWTARHVLAELTEHQNVAIAAVVREGDNGREYLMTRNAGYLGYFPVASRVRSDVGPRFQAREGFRLDTGYERNTDAGEPRQVTDRHHSPRFDCARDFVYHVTRLNIPRVDLNERDNALARTLERSGALWRWVADAELDAPALNGLSPTIAVVRDALRAV